MRREVRVDTFALLLRGVQKEFLSAPTKVGVSRSSIMNDWLLRVQNLTRDFLKKRKKSDPVSRAGLENPGSRGRLLLKFFKKLGRNMRKIKENAQERKSPKRRKNRRGGRKRETREIGNFGKMCALRAKIN